ncbi:CAP family protein [Aridibaculum aurantiacum]|uniref:CAP family protein n=1 Tax=Aridibaculum aurantiacum TaxID=2810307 RepID=UPI001A95F14F|nr:CAP family protein [Aridibaculum aurantiacum]
MTAFGKHLLLLAAVALAWVNAGAQSSNRYTGSALSAAEASKILEHHNQARKEVGVQPLEWSTSMSSYAQEWANYLAATKGCDLIHRQRAGEDGKKYGENLFWGSSTRSYQPSDASNAWYSEKGSYVYDQLANNNWNTTGHYTQMIWKGSREIGVGVAYCAGGGLIVVANYYPAGNVISQYPY